ncbi:MAG: tetratricopeptide repeat protein, partial [Gemmatimonadaceae bacterium]
KRFDEAEQAFEKAMRLDPKLYEAPYFYGRARMSQGRFMEAVKLFERAATLRPEDFQVLHFLGQSYHSLGMEAEAVSALRREMKLIEERLELNPDDARACNLGAGVLANLGEKERALDFAERSLAIDSEDPMLLYNVACTYSVLGQHDDAITCLERAVDKGFGHKEWIEHDPDLNPIRANPRFQGIAQAM